jgi:glutamate---cysteine ligase / carboxylate-amine ligase
MPKPAFHLFERFGVELEYMIVDTDTLDVLPIADRLIHAVGSARKNEVRHGAVRWSNELVLHVLEMKTDGPAPSLDGLAGLFQSEVRALDDLLRDHGARLLPSAMHPWMDPHRETRLWPHGDKTIYETFHRIFDCRGHGWSNLQSTHLNLPFHGDDEFNRLHTAVRLVLPLLPALAASSPYLEGRRAPHLDMRLEAYRRNCDRIPSITGRTVPEWIPSQSRYQSLVFDRIARDLAPLDPDGILEPEWTNARGAIARFSRGTIEIRLLDIQECPAADLAILQFVVAILKNLVDESLAPRPLQKNQRVADLETLLLDASANAEQSVIADRRYLAALGLPKVRAASARDVLQSLLDHVAPPDAPWRPAIEFILRHGPLARRLLKAAGRRPSRTRLRETYTRLADCLHDGRRFAP